MTYYSSTLDFYKSFLSRYWLDFDDNTKLNLNRMKWTPEEMAKGNLIFSFLRPNLILSQKRYISKPTNDLR